MRTLFCSAATLALIAATPALAQTASDKTSPRAAAVDSANAESSAVVGEVVVTAQRREEQLKDVPATISAVTAQQLEALGPVNGTGDLLKTVPGVRFNDLQSNNLSEVSIRGSGTQRATGADSGVGLFFNGAYVGSSTLGGRNFRAVDSFDPERVEVLEGPQGALYGRNSEFGVVNIVSAKPKFTHYGFVNAQYTGKTEQTKVIGVLNEPINDDVAIRVGVQNVEQGAGWYYNPKSDRYYDKTAGWISRGQVRVTKGKLDVDVLADFQNMTLPTFLNSYDLQPGLIAAIPLGFHQSHFDVAHDGKDGVHQNTERGMILADYDLPFGKLTSTSMATHWTSVQNFAAAIDTVQETAFQQLGELGLYPFGQTTTGTKDRTLYQDLHLAGNAMSDRLSYLVGADYIDQKDLNSLDAATTPCTFAIGRGICYGTPINHQCFLPLPTSTACPAVFPAVFGQSTRAHLRVKSYSVYSLVRYSWGALTASGELRYSHDEKVGSQKLYQLFTTVQAAAPATYDFGSDRINYTLNLSYKLPNEVPGGIIYAKVGTGFRAGGINARVSSPLAPNPFSPTYGDEDTTSYEVGYKGNLRPNIFFRLSGYASRTENAITSINDGCTVLNACGQAGVQFNINGGTVEAKGVEAAIDGRFHILDGLLTVSLNGGRQHAKYVETPGGYSGLPIVGSSVAQIPKWTSSATVGYRHSIVTNLDGFANLSYQGQTGGTQDATTAATPAIQLNSLDFMNLRTGLDYKKLELAIFVTNLTNKQIALLQFQSTGVTFANRNSTPRTVGANLIYRW